jgi:hypothetical protein
MNQRMEDSVTIDRLLQEAQARVTRAGDLVEPRQSLTHLFSALETLARVERLLHPGDGTNQPDSIVLSNLAHRHRRKLMGVEDTPAIIGRVLASVTAAHGDALLVNDAIPAVWRLLKGLMADAQSQRPLGRYPRMAVRALTFILATWLLYQAVRLLLPFGSWVVYYNDLNLQKPAALRSEFGLHKNFGVDRPAAFVHRNGWSARWTGKFFAPKRASYDFYIQSDDGVRFWVDDQLLIDHWQDTSWSSSGQHASMKLSAGPHHFRLEHFKRNGNGAIRLRWTGGGIPPNTVLGYPYLYKY